MIGQIDRQFLLILTLAVFGISSRQGVDEKVGGTENNIPEKGVEMNEEMCERFDPASQLGFHGDLGLGWHLVREEEREGKCPGTREKVETHLA